MNPIDVLISLLILAVIIWLAFYIVGKMELDPPGRKIASVIVGLICLILLLGLLGVFPGGAWLHWKH